MATLIPDICGSNAVYIPSSCDECIVPEGTLNIGANGEFDVTEYAMASVNVPIPSGYIRPSGTSSITQNGIYDITNFASVDVNVSGGGGGITVDDVAMRTISGVIVGDASRIFSAAFEKCSLITEVRFSNVKSIASNAFRACTDMSILYAPLVESIETEAFKGTALVSADFPNLTYMSSSAFESCSSLEMVSMPLLSSALPTGAFRGCYNLSSVYLPLTTYIGSGAFSNCSSLTAVEFPNASGVYDFAFANCINLSVISLPKLRSRIWGSAFSGCKALMSIYLLYSQANASLYGSDQFKDTPITDSSFTGSFGSIYVPASLVDTYKSKANWSTYADRITSYVE